MWLFGIWVAQKGGDVFCVGFWMRPMRSSTSPHLSWTAASSLALSVFSPPYLFMNYLERWLSLLRWIVPRGTWEKPGYVYTSRALWESSWDNLEQIPCFWLLKKGIFWFWIVEVSYLQKPNPPGKQLALYFAQFKKDDRSCENVGNQSIDQKTHRIIKISTTNI